MRIIDLLKPEAIRLNQSVADKAEAIEQLIGLHAAVGNIHDKEVFRQDILKREELGSTAVGEGVAIPHAKSAAVSTPGTCCYDCAKWCRLRRTGWETL